MWNGTQTELSLSYNENIYMCMYCRYIFVLLSGRKYIKSILMPVENIHNILKFIVAFLEIFLTVCSCFVIVALCLHREKILKIHSYHFRYSHFVASWCCYKRMAFYNMYLKYRGGIFHPAKLTHPRYLPPIGLLENKIFQREHTYFALI